MKILTGIDLPFIPNCGSMILANDLYSDLPDGIEVRFLALFPSVPKNWSSIKDVQLLKIKKETDPKNYPAYVNLLAKEIEKQVKDYKPDVIHIQHLSFGMALAFSNIDLPKLAICHGTDIQFALQNEFHKKNVINIYNKSQMIVFPTHKIFDEFTELTVYRDKSVIIPWGIPNDICTMLPNKIPLSKKILYAGRLDENKNVDTIIKAMRYINPTISLAIIGEGDQKDKLIDLTKEYNLESRVSFIDFLPRQKLWDKFKEFDVAIISTKKIEAFCLTAVEAQAHGLPVIYSRTNGLIEVIGKSGVSFEAQNEKGLAEAINKLLHNERLLQEYSTLGKDNAQRFRISKTRNAFINISENLINQHARS